MSNKVEIEIDVDNDFDGIDLELAIKNSSGTAREILKILHHKWVNKIGEPGWSMLGSGDEYE